MTFVPILFFSIIISSLAHADMPRILPPSDHYDGKVFRNNPSTAKKSIFDLIRWRFSRTAPVEENFTPLKNSLKPAKINISNDVSLSFVGHATFLLQANGLNVLTDPIWSDRCSPLSFLGPKRLQEPGIAFENLPKIDIVLISHNHYDHLDLPTLKRLWLRDRPTFIVPLKNKALLASEGITNIIELDWWESTQAKSDVKITAVPAQHWSGRWIIDRNEALWAGFVISFDKKNIFFAGDTGFGPHFIKIKEKFVTFELALIPIGAYLPLWFMREHHLSPSDAIVVADIMGALQNIPMHFGTFSLGDDGFTKARYELNQLMANNKKQNFLILEVGQAWKNKIDIVEK